MGMGYGRASMEILTLESGIGLELMAMASISGQMETDLKVNGIFA